MLHSVHFLLEISAAERTKPIGLLAARVILFMKAFNPTVLEQAAQGAVECAGAEAHTTAAHLLGISKDGVPVTRMSGKAKED
jgi:hypothetical protein